MRTDTNTFAKRVFKDLRAAGLSAAAATAGRNAILSAAHAFGYPLLDDSARACVSMDSEDSQSVYVDERGLARFHAGVADHHQPLVNTTPSDEQLEIADELCDIRCSIYEAVSLAEDAGSKEPFKDAAVVALNKQYDELRERSIAINPFVHAGHIDPDAYDFYSMMHKDTYGFRPRGYITFPTMKDKMERLRKANELEMAA